MNTNLPSKVTVVGVGVIGRSWIRVFARAGIPTWVYDRDPLQLDKAMRWLEEDLAQDVAEGFLTTMQAKAERSQVHPATSLREALAGAIYVQESGPEQLALKQAIYAEIDRTADAATIIGSSTSALDMTEIAQGLPGARRCLVAHPVNPPHLIPVVEVLPGQQTENVVTASTFQIMRAVGQRPVRMNFYIKGFLLNRMQAALLREAIYLVTSGVAEVEAVDTVIAEGLGLRWALLGPFGVGNANADGGIREYLGRYGAAYADWMDELGPTPRFDPELIERLGRQTDAVIPAAHRTHSARWRDNLIREIRELKRLRPPPFQPNEATSPQPNGTTPK